jgi:hypothetical protein
MPIEELPNFTVTIAWDINAMNHDNTPRSNDTARNGFVLDGPPATPPAVLALLDPTWLVLDLGGEDVIVLLRRSNSAVSIRSGAAASLSGAAGGSSSCGGFTGSGDS